MQDQHQFRPLADLDDYELKNQQQDIRGKAVIGPTGDRLGEVRELLVDKDHDRVAAVRLDDGAVLPVESLERRGETIFVQGPGAAAATQSQEERIPVVREEMLIGKRVVDRGSVRVQSHIVAEPVREQLSLREEHVSVEMRPASSGRGEIPADAFQDRTIAMGATGEEAVVTKQARVVGEVVVRKDVDQRIEQIDDTVRHTEFEVQDGQAARTDPGRT